MRKKTLIILVACLFFADRTIAQVNENDRFAINKIYEQAERLFRSNNSSASLDYLKKEGAAYLNSSDSLMYLKIKILESLYRADFVLTTELESSLKQFLNKVNKYSFPELKYSEVARIYSDFSSFKGRDKMFYDSVSRVMDLNNTPSLPDIRAITANYLTATHNSYYHKELTTNISNIDNRLAELAMKKKRHELDSANRKRLKLVGKKTFLNLSYSVPSGDMGSFSGLHNYSDVVNFFSGKYSGGLGEKYAVNASLGGASINLYTGSRAKVAINWDLFDGEYAVFDWSKDTLIHDEIKGGSTIGDLKSIKAGTRIGPMVSILLAKRIAAAVYYSARPGIQFLMHSSYFSNGSDSYSIKPVIASFNLSHEIGIRFYFFENLFISPYFHFGTYTWQNDIIKSSGSTPDLRVKANYKFNYLGLRVGF